MDIHNYGRHNTPCYDEELVPNIGPKCKMAHIADDADILTLRS